METKSCRIKKARNKSGKVIILAIMWLIVIDNTASYFQLGRLFVIATVLPLVMYRTYPKKVDTLIVGNNSMLLTVALISHLFHI